MELIEKVIVTGRYGLVGHAIQEIIKTNDKNKISPINRQLKG
jgi:hypothetical protein